MSKELNYHGKIRFVFDEAEIYFSKVVSKISCEEIKKSYENFNRNTLSKILGYRIKSDFTIYITNEDTDESSLFNLIRGLISLERDMPIVVNFYDSTDTNIIQSFSFNLLTSKIDFNKYLKGNSLLGLDFQFSLSSRDLLSSIPPFWKNEVSEDLYIWSNTINFDELIFGDRNAI